MSYSPVAIAASTKVTSSNAVAPSGGVQPSSGPSSYTRRETTTPSSGPHPSASTARVGKVSTIVGGYSIAGTQCPPLQSAVPPHEQLGSGPSKSSKQSVSLASHRPKSSATKQRSMSPHASSAWQVGRTHPSVSKIDVTHPHCIALQSM